MKRKWGVQVKVAPDTRLEPVIEQAARDGLSMIEFRAPTRCGATLEDADVFGDEKIVDEIRRLCRVCGIEPAYHAPQGGPWDFGAGFPVAHSQAVLETCIRRGARLGARLMTIHVIVNPNDRSNSIRRAARALDRAETMAAANHVRPCIENVFRDRFLYSVEDIRLLLQHSRSSRFGLTLDTGHANLYGALEEMVQVIHPRLAFIHAHDNAGDRDAHRAPGRGTIDWPVFMRLLDAYAYAGPVIFELREECDLPAVIARLEQRSPPCASFPDLSR
ncbi:MAG: sugar phosphate isomerase/epimerase [Kiritimatiellaeota bacterium]|nr:sugar phosphate isomerase/epimerase [Kiritimatiellota bacterium]